MTITRGRWRAWVVDHESWVFPIGIALVARICLSLFGALIVSTTAIPLKPEYYYGLTPLSPTGFDLLFGPFQRWDVLWYEVIATRGYSSTDSSGAFFPLFPLLTRVVTAGTGATLLVGTLIATVSTAASFVLFYRISLEWLDRKAARLGLIVWVTFPVAFYLFIPYAEALFVFLAMACLEAARRNKWLAAGIAGGLAALARTPGVWLIFPLGVEWLEQARARDWRMRVKTALPLLLVPLGTILFSVYLQIFFGDALMWVRAFAEWENNFFWPWQTVALTIGEIVYGEPGAILNNALDLGATIFVLGMVVLGLLPKEIRSLSLRGWQPRLPLSFGIYGLMFVILPLAGVAHELSVARVPMANAARHAVIIFPAFMMAGQFLQGRLRAPLWIALSLSLQIIFAYIFVRWLWVD